MLVGGKNVFRELVNSPKKINKVYLLKDFSDKNIISFIKKNNIEVVFLSKRDFDEFEFSNSQGIICDINDYDYKNMSVIKDDELIVILDHIEDPHNFGAIIRTCEAAGVKNVIIPKNRSVRVTSTVMKASSGALSRVNVILVTNITTAIKELQKKGFWIAASDISGDDYTKIDYKGKMGIVIGNEGKGVSRIVKKESDYIVSIPMNGEVNSLNASVACGVVLFEAIRQRR